MAYVLETPHLGMPPIGAVDTTAKWKLGDVVRGNDPTLGSGEFIYLRGILGTLAGLMVNYTARTGVTALTLGSGVVLGGSPVAVAMAATVDDTYGWYQISGDATVLKTAVAITPATVKVYLSATVGRAMPTSVSGRQVLGARWGHTTTIAAATSTAIVTLNRPMQQGQIT